MDDLDFLQVRLQVFARLDDDDIPRCLFRRQSSEQDGFQGLAH